MINKKTCSRCGEKRNLHLITFSYGDNNPSGRLLLYCFDCRTSQDVNHKIDTSIPIEIVTESILEDLYRLKKTYSDPDTFLKMILEVDNPNLLNKINKILKKNEKENR
tara:strand:+ start:28 stop:351 length:324 start_codon:yes stop_codon:yes gene_type:complete